jgi:hypothetical protein
MRQRKIEDEDEVGTEMDGQMEGETDEPDTPRRLHRKHVDEDTEPVDEIEDRPQVYDEDGDTLDPDETEAGGYQIEE